MVESSSTEKVLGIQIDSDLTFDEHISPVCNKLGKKLMYLANYMSLDKRCMVMKNFIESQFNYYPLIWMFHSRTLNNKINRLHKRALRIVYSDCKSSFRELLEKDKSFLIHHKNFKSLAIEPCILNNIFTVNKTIPYDLRKRNVLQSRNLSSVTYGTETISCIAQKVIVTCF